MTRDGRVEQLLGLVVGRATTLLRRHGVEIRDRSVVVGYSGGVDSTVLVHVLRSLVARPHVVHVNYGLRGDESDQDEAFVVSRCETLGIEYEVVRVDPASLREYAGSLHEEARRIRYEAFEAVADRLDAPFVAVAHTLNDQSETLLLHLLRGTGVDGVAGMRVSRPLSPGSDRVLIRPLLSTSREEVERLAAETGLSWRTDASNEDPKFARARLRTIVVPAIEQAFGGGRWLNVGRSGLRMGEQVVPIAGAEAARRFEDVASPDGNRLSVDLLLATSPTRRGRIILEAMRRWAPDAPQSSQLISRIEELLGAPPGKRVEAGGLVVVRDRQHLTFVPSPPEARPDVAPVILKPGTSVVCGPHRVHMYELAGVPGSLDLESPDATIVDGSIADQPVSVRPWQAGDRMTPIGLGGRSRLISDVMTDRKVPPSRRPFVPVVLAAESVAWCVGVAPSERFKVTQNTRRWFLLFRTSTSHPCDEPTEA